MERVRREMGDEAVILSTRLVEDPRAMTCGERVEMTAAVDWESMTPQSAGRGAALGAEARSCACGRSDEASTGQLASIEERLVELQRRLKLLPGAALAPDELALETVYRTVYAAMLANEVEPVLALRVVRATRQRLEGVDERADVACVVQKTLESLLPSKKREDKRVQVLVGPTGVGKTTTAAKLAAREILKGSGPVVLVTCDTYRVAAVEQLRAYALAMGASFELARDVSELDAVLERHRGARRVVVDTEGRGQRDLKALEYLFRYIGSHAEVERQLVLAATTKPRDLGETVERFRGAGPQGLIFTKVDETNSYGSILSESVRSELPVTYLGTGQRVPEEILEASPRKLAELAVSALA